MNIEVTIYLTNTVQCRIIDNPVMEVSNEKSRNTERSWLLQIFLHFVKIASDIKIKSYMLRHF